ncbi:glycosyltransferase 87 family protein [Actinoplanes sp. NPDC051861]|uniref:glycosyltransferase 87 family protein n=1 Tax=Actinoplanes sp. NPDC051861 TaxID=3155170 RepID=UPI00344352D3
MKRWSPAILVALIAGYLALSRPEGLTDLRVYVGGVESLQSGTGLYDYFRNGTAPFTYPPFAALLMLPLSAVPTGLLHLIWTAGTALAVAALALLVDRRAAPLVALVLMLSAPVSSTFKYGQVSLLLAVLVATDVLLLRHSRHQGVLIGLAAAIKLTPLIFIPMLWLTGRRRAAGVATATFLACGLLAAHLLPAESWRYWTTEFHDVSRLGFITSVGNQSLNGALLRLGVPHRELLATALAGLIAATALLATRNLDRLAALVITGAASVVLSPVSWTHHQIWLVLAAFLPLAHATRALILAVMLLPVTALGLWPLQESRLLLATALCLALPALLSSPPLPAVTPTPRGGRCPTPPSAAPAPPRPTP